MDYDEELDGADSVYWDDYNDDLDVALQHQYFSQAFAAYTFYDLWHDCLLPTLADGISASKTLIIFCIIIRLTIYLGNFPKSALTFLFIGTGVFCLYNFFQHHSFYVVTLAIFGIACLFISNHLFKRCGVISALSCVIFVSICELFVAKSNWHKIRGSQMVLVMKIISLAFDIDSGLTHLPSVPEQLGYFFCPGTLIFGPWVSYNEHRAILENPATLVNCINIISALLSSFLFLTISTCWSSWLIGDIWRWTSAYRDALSFRSSHYFICYLSLVTTLLLGIDIKKVVSPSKIEFPRSLVEVVIYWNTPMHQWLKTYVFRVVKPYGNFLAIFITYTASSILHGLNFQLAAVLLSLGFYTYVEYVLRNKLAVTFDACIEARSCKDDCQHKNQSKNPYVISANLFFGFMTVFHLAYLGVMFDSSSSIQDEGYNMHHTLSKWSELSFASHWVALITYGVYLLI